MICAKCGSTDLKTRGRVSHVAYYTPFEDENGLHHNHDMNNCWEDFTCNECGHITTKNHYNTCWCGWTNGEPNNIYHTVETRERPKGFKNYGRQITNQKWIDNIKISEEE